MHKKPLDELVDDVQSDFTRPLDAVEPRQLIEAAATWGMMRVLERIRDGESGWAEIARHFGIEL